MTEDSTEDFLEHYGVKGMKWGVRRARNHKQSRAEKSLNRQLRKAGNAYRSAPDSRKENAKKVAKIGAGIAAAAGAAYVGHKIATGGSVKASSLTSFEGHMRKAAQHRQAFFKAPVPKAKSPVKFTPEGAKSIAALKAKMKETNRLANESLKAGYEKSQTPLPLREYLSLDF